MDVNELRRKRLREVLAEIRAASGGFKAADNIPREKLYDRQACNPRRIDREPVTVEGDLQR